MQGSGNLDPIQRAMEELGRLPGIGPKSAQRITYFLLRAPGEQVVGLAQAIASLKEKTHLCPVCFNIATGELCSICSDSRRDSSTVCVVEQPQDIASIERLGAYKGLYHVLHGAISPSEGINTSDIRVKELISRVERGDIQEVIIATNSTMEGEQTALYLKKLIAPMGIQVTRLARGLPFGTELEYADDVTLSRAFEGRSEF